MQIQHIWQQDSNNPENASELTAIQQWWATLAGKEINWRQRLIPANGETSEINWEPQRFDEVFLISNPQLRGITLYWYKPGIEGERSITPHKLELDTLRQQLYLYPQSQRDIIVRVGLPEIKYQTLTLKNPDVAVGKNTILLRDKDQQLEIKIALTPDKLAQLRKQLSSLE